jgi:hypothetical protein
VIGGELVGDGKVFCVLLVWFGLVWKRPWLIDDSDDDGWKSKDKKARDGSRPLLYTNELVPKTGTDIHYPISLLVHHDHTLSNQNGGKKNGSHPHK